MYVNHTFVIFKKTFAIVLLEMYINVLHNQSIN